ncbi:hypothetical protein ACMYSO_02005 [Klebsiella sp. B345]
MEKPSKSKPDTSRSKIAGFLPTPVLEELVRRKFKQRPDKKQ